MICDLAETYGIFNYKGMPLSLVATLVFGLGEKSRIQRKMRNVEYGIDTILLAAALDNLAFIAWSKTKDAEKGTNMPKSIVREIIGKSENESDIVTFNTADEFEKARLEILRE